jgi:putative dimethyl sulfoxide reductase chaperone
MGDLTIDAELYLSFALVFHRPQPQSADNLEEFIDLWTEELGIEAEDYQLLMDFCTKNPPGESRVNALWEHYIPLFEVGSIEAPPYASVYFQDNAQVMGDEAFAVKRFYEASGYSLGESPEQLPDHIAVELEFMALLARDGKYEQLMEFRVKHLLPFLKQILPRIQESRRTFYSTIARLIQNWQFKSDESR